MLESKIQSDHMKRVKAKGGLCLKFVSPGRRNVPDCIDLYGTLKGTLVLQDALERKGIRVQTGEILRLVNQIVEASIQFTECKQLGKDATEGQAREHQRLRELGFTVNVVDGS
jgi:hypothetical protein